MAQEQQFIYFLESSQQCGLFKIGITGNVEQRFSQLKVGTLSKCVVVEDIGRGNARTLERYLHNQFRAKRLPQSEWFSLTETDVAAVKSSINAAHEQEIQRRLIKQQNEERKRQERANLEALREDQIKQRVEEAARDAHAGQQRIINDLRSQLNAKNNDLLMQIQHLKSTNSHLTDLLSDLYKKGHRTASDVIYTALIVGISCFLIGYFYTNAVNAIKFLIFKSESTKSIAPKTPDIFQKAHYDLVYKSRLLRDLTAQKNVLLSLDPSDKIGPPEYQINVRTALDMVSNRILLFDEMNKDKKPFYRYQEHQKIGYQWRGIPQVGDKYFTWKLFTISSMECKKPRVSVDFINPKNNFRFYSNTYWLKPSSDFRDKGYYIVDIKVDRRNGDPWNHFKVNVNSYCS